MTDITPPPELVQRWIRCDKGGPDVIHRIANCAAQWGADQELEACCEWLAGWCRDEYPGGIENLRAARRPKPPSLKLRIAEAIAKGDKQAALSILDEAIPDD